MEGFNAIEDVVNAINDLHAGHSVPAGLTTYTGTPEGLAAKYATADLQADRSDLLREAEAHLEALAEAGAKFDFSAAADKAKENIIHQLLYEAEQELGSNSQVAERVAWLLGDDGQQFVAVSAGDFADEIGLDDLALAAGAEKECALVTDDGDIEPHPCSQMTSQSRVRYTFDDGSAIVEAGDGWDIEGDEPFTWSGA